MTTSRYPIKRIFIGVFKCTGYNNVPGQCDNTPDITASGRRIVLGNSVALSPKYWKLFIQKRVVLFVEGVGEVYPDDTGSAIQDKYRMDISCATKAMAYKVTGLRKVWLILK